MGKTTCDICGDAGFDECTVTCDGCKVACQHVYCMRQNSLIKPEVWFCEECCPRDHMVQGSSIEALKPNAAQVVCLENKQCVSPEQEPNDKAFYPCSSLKVESQPSNNNSCSSWQKGPKRRKGKRFSASRHRGEKAGKTCKRVTFATKSDIIPDDKFCFDDKSTISSIQERPLSYDLLQFEKYPSNRPNLEAVWNGSFKILEMVSLSSELYVGFRAHLPRIVASEVYKYSKQMPEVLQFKLLPCSDIWAEIFQNDGALGYDISLYFFPGKFERSLQQYVCLLRLMEMQDLVMRSCINDLELLVFTSKRLHYAEELNWISFLWGVFRVMRNKNAAATPAGFRTSEDYDQSYNAGTVRQNSSEVKNKLIHEHYAHSDISKRMVYSKAAYDLILD